MSTMMHPGYTNERLLWICVGVSMLIHAVIVWQGHAIPPAAPLSPPIKATIRPYVPPAPVAAPEPPKPEPKKAEPPREPKPLPKPVVPEAPRLKPIDQPKPVSAPTAPPVAAPQPAPATPATPTTDAKADAAKAPAASAAALPSSADPDERALVRGFQLQLATAAEKYKRYPSEAMQQAWEGKALVRLHIGTDGKTAGVEIVNSSGHEILDDQAKVAINKAKPLVQVPPGLRGKEFVADIVMVFTLKQ